MPKVSVPLTTRMANAMAEATAFVDWDSPERRRDAFAVAAVSAREVMAEQVRSYVNALRRACIDRKHPGSVPPRGDAEGAPCSRCGVKIKHATEVCAIIAPDRPE